MTQNPGTDLRKERILFGLLVLLQVALYAWLIVGRRMMKTHDTLYVYQLQYLFLSHSCQNGDLPLWFPYSYHGIVTNWYANIQGGLFQNALLFLGGVPEGTNLLPVFHLGMFFDEFILLVGVWSLGRRYYSSPYTRFFVTAAIIGSSFWATQFSWNLNLFHGVPLLISLLLGFLEDGKRWNLFLAGNFAALQFTGNVAYMPGMTLFVVCVYFLIHAFLFPACWAARLKSMRPRPVDLLVLVLNGLVLLALYATISEGASSIRQYRPGRNADASVTLDAFLTYAGTLHPARYADFLLGATPHMDYTLYAGACVPAFALLGILARPGKAVLHLLLCLLVCLFISMGYLSLAGAVAYEGFPLLRFFRYVTLVSPFVKLFLILLSGYGVDAVISGRSPATGMLKGPVLPILLISLGIALFVLFAGGRVDALHVLRAAGSGLATRSPVPANPATHPVGLTGAATALFGILLLLRGRRTIGPGVFIPLLLLLETADVSRWKIQLLRQETVALTDPQYALQEIRPLPFIARRNADYESSERYRILREFSFNYGARYDLTDAFVHLDPPVTRFRTLYWLAPFEALVQAQNGRPVGSRPPELPIFQGVAGSNAPDPAGPYSKIIGMTMDKIQVFSRAHVAESDQALADFMNRPGFQGDVLLTRPRTPGASLPGTPLGDRTDLLAANQRIAVQPEILHFDLNRLTLKVPLPPGQDGWLLYADVWDPGWTATVNEKSVAVEPAFLAYKAVRLEPGTNVVRFEFRAPRRTWGYRLLGLSSLGWIGCAVLLAFQLLRGSSARSG